MDEIDMNSEDMELLYKLSILLNSLYQLSKENTPSSSVLSEITLHTAFSSEKALSEASSSGALEEVTSDNPKITTK